MHRQQAAQMVHLRHHHRQINKDASSLAQRSHVVAIRGLSCGAAAGHGTSGVCGPMEHSTQHNAAGLCRQRIVDGALGVS